MLALAICVVAFLTCYWAGRRSLGQGLVALMFFGYFYGILRANLITTFSHFIFDAGMVGLFLSPKWRAVSSEQKKRSKILMTWATILIGWPCLVLLLPFQPFLVSLVGLRGHIFFVPLLLLGARMSRKDLVEFSAGIAVLDLVAVGFATAEYFMGVPRFYPESPVTEIIYHSQDVEGGFYRIPAIFTAAHAFGGTMVATIPFLIGLWSTAQDRLLRMLGLIGMPVALMGILMSATRLNFVLGCAMITFVVATAKIKTKHRVILLLIIMAVGVAALRNVRFQRFKSLTDTEAVSERIAGSVNRSFWELLAQYPMGNGLGGGGTSIPYFLQGQVRNPIGLESEYARILCEQGVIGLLLWLAFIVWFFSRMRVAFAKGAWATTRRMLWCLTFVLFGTGLIGTGLMTSIPGTVLMMLAIGWSVLPESSPVLAKARSVLRPQAMPRRTVVQLQPR